MGLFAIGSICWVMVCIHIGVVLFKPHLNLKMKRGSAIQKNKKGCKENVERAFGVFQARWSIIQI